MKISKVSIALFDREVVTLESPKNCGAPLELNLEFSPTPGNSRVVVFDSNNKTETFYNWEHVLAVEFVRS